METIHFVFVQEDKPVQKRKEVLKKSFFGQRIMSIR